MQAERQVDKNLIVKEINSRKYEFRNCLEEPFQICGVIRPSEKYPYFQRIPQDVADTISPNVAHLTRKTAGGRVRFCTDSAAIAIRVELMPFSRMPHFSILGTTGLDLYADNVCVGAFVPPFDVDEGYEQDIQLDGKKMRQITINMPLYGGIRNLEIGLEPGARLLPCPPYRLPVPVVYYGSSITQGGCASRPGTAYEHVISRRLDCDHINIGLSGNAKGEENMAKHIAGLNMSAFVMDYDYNAPMPEHLEATHSRMFRIIRQAHPLLPVIMISRPAPVLDENGILCREIIRRTFEEAIREGDQNVWFIDGSRMIRSFGGAEGLVDNCHPNDLGFACMAQVIGDRLEKILIK